ncbi:MAG: hypothetical protein ABII12_01790 [Planctomycetota bacterium]
MVIQFRCTHCGQPIEVDDDMAGKAVTCPYCSKVATTPAETDMSVRADAPPAGMPEAGGSLPYALSPPPKPSILPWLALGCVVLSVLFVIYAAIAGKSVTEGLNMQPKTQDEAEVLGKTIEERVSAKPSLRVASILGVCAMPVLGVILAIVALVKRSRPRWPAITALCLLGLAIVGGCVAVVMQMSAMSGAAGGG